MTLFGIIREAAHRLGILGHAEREPMDHPRKIILVGHCGPDMFMLKGAVERAVPNVVVETSNDDQSICAHLDADAVLLINRVLDGRFKSNSGVDLVRSIREKRPGAVMMLISNFEDAQHEAEQAGAYPGFGKSQLYDDETMSKLRDAIGAR